MGDFTFLKVQAAIVYPLSINCGYDKNTQGATAQISI